MEDGGIWRLGDVHVCELYETFASDVGESEWEKKFLQQRNGSYKTNEDELSLASGVDVYRQPSSLL